MDAGRAAGNNGQPDNNITANVTGNIMAKAGVSMDDRAKVDCVANARALAPVIAAAALRIEATRELPPDLVDALHEARLWRMLLPRSYGGDEVSPVDYVQAIEEIAKADASTAWCIGQTSVCGPSPAT